MPSYSFLVKVGADITDFEKKMTNFSKSLGDTGSKMQSIGKTMTVGLTAPLVGLAGASIKLAMDFEQGMSNVKAVSGATGDQMKQLTDLAMKMGAETKYSSIEASKGLEELLKAGVSVEDILGKNALGGALALASAGEIELADAAEIASNVLNAFAKDGLSVSQAADILAGSANASATSVGELRYALSASAAVASSVGMTFQDTATALSLFANRGLKGSDAGTSLKTMLMNLQPSTKAQTALFNELGLVAEDGTSKFYNEAGSLRSLEEIAGLLQSSMSGLTDAQRLQAMQTMFGSDAIRGASILFDAGTKGVTDMKNAIGNVTAEDVAKIKTDNLAGALEKMKGSLESAGVAFGNVFSPAVVKASQVIENFGNWLAKLSPAQQQFIALIGVSLAVLGPLIFIIGTLIALLPALQVLTTGLGISLKVLSANVLLALGAFLLIIAIGWLIVSNWETIKNFGIWVWSEIVKAWMGAGVFFTNLWNNVKTSSEEIWGNIITFFTVTVPQKFQELLNWFKDLPGKIGNFLSSLPEQIAYYFGVGLGVTVRIIIQAIFNIVSLFMGLPGQIGKALVNLWNTLVSWGRSFKAWADTTGREIFFNLYNWFNNLPNRIWSSLVNLWNTIVSWGRSFKSWADSSGRDMFFGLYNWFQKLPDSIWNALSNIWNNLSNWKNALMSKAQSIGSSVWQGFKAGLGINSPSYIEQAFFNMAIASNQALASIKSNIPKYQSALNSISSPVMGLVPATDTYGFMENASSPEMNNFNVDTLVVREDADIYRIAKELYRLQQNQLRAQGR